MQQYFIQQPQQNNISLQQQLQLQPQQPQVLLNSLKLNQQQQQQGLNPNLNNLNINPNPINLAGNPQAINVLANNVGGINNVNPQILQQQGRLMGQPNQGRGQMIGGGGYASNIGGYGINNNIGAIINNNDLNLGQNLGLGGVANMNVNSANIGIPAGLVNHNAAAAVGSAAGINTGFNSGINLNTGISLNPLGHLQNTQQSQHQLGLLSNAQSLISEPDLIKEVWSSNLHAEFNVIRKLAKTFRYISLSTEVPGIIARPIGKFQSVSDYHYQTMRVNSDISNLIQLSITLSDVNGRKPNNLNANLPSTWQFNFKFDLNKEMYSSETINDLKLTGINFEKFEKFGVEHKEFAELLIDSGLVLNETHDIYWISFNCGYDFGFLSSLLINTLMPNESEDFLWWCNKFFVNFYDIKYISLHQSNLFSGNNNLASHLVNGLGGNNNNNSTGNGNNVGGNNTSATNNNNGTANNGGISAGGPEINFKRFSLDNLADNLGIPVQQSNYLQSGNQSLLTNICFFELKRLISLSSNDKEHNNLENFKNLIWGITKNNEALFNVSGSVNSNANSSNSNAYNLSDNHNPSSMNISTPLQHAMSMGMNVNSPMYLNR